MNVAFLFNSDDEIFGGSYGDPIISEVLRSNVLQSCGRRKRFSIGDLLTFSDSKTYGEFRVRSAQATNPAGLDLRLSDRLNNAVGKVTIFIVTVQNIGIDHAKRLHEFLYPRRYYLGAIEVDFSNPPHLVYFRNSIGEIARLAGSECVLFHDMGDEESARDDSLVAQFEGAGFTVRYEDRGARRTIFDNFDTLDHFKRISALQSYLTAEFEMPAEESENLIYSLEEINPYLFDCLAAAVKQLSKNATGEELVHGAISARRFLKLLTDIIYPPTNKTVAGHKLSDHHVKNRFWAYLYEAFGTTESRGSDTVKGIGREFDRLFDESSSMVHRLNIAYDEVRALLIDTIRLTARAFAANPERAAQVYGPYQDALVEFFRETLRMENGP